MKTQKEIEEFLGAIKNLKINNDFNYGEIKALEWVLDKK